MNATGNITRDTLWITCIPVLLLCFMHTATITLSRNDIATNTKHPATKDRLVRVHDPSLLWVTPLKTSEQFAQSSQSLLSCVHSPRNQTSIALRWGVPGIRSRGGNWICSVGGYYATGMQNENVSEYCWSMSADKMIFVRQMLDCASQIRSLPLWCLQVHWACSAIWMVFVLLFCVCAFLYVVLSR